MTQDITTLERVAYLHTLHMELGQTQDELSFSPKHSFGIRGKDYSSEYWISSEPLFRVKGKLEP